MISSAMPSQKYCCSASELMFLNRRTATDEARSSASGSSGVESHFEAARVEVVNGLERKMEILCGLKPLVDVLFQAPDHDPFESR